MSRTGAEALVECLKKQNVDIVFGYPGGVLLGIYDTLFDADILHVLPRHEQGGVHAADGYARATGKVGVCFGTSGPGATNLVTGIANAYMDSVPLVAFTGQVPTALIGGDAFQEADIIGITRPIVKHSYLVQNVDDLPRVINEAFYIASTGRPGPVVIDLPKDVVAGKTKTKCSGKIDLPGYNPTYEGHPLQIKKLLKELSEAKKPVIYAGGGVIISGATEELVKLSERIGLPVVNSFLGLGGFPSAHENYVGWLGMHGNFASNMAMTETDFILAIGTRFSDRSTGRLDGFAPNAKIAHIDIDPASISKIVDIDIPVVGDCKKVLKQMEEYLDKFNWEKNAESRKGWLKKIRAWNSERPFSYKKSDKVIKPQFVVEEICRLTDGEAIIATEVGQNQMWAGQFYKFKHPRQFISSGGLGTMGFGFPAAIGAKLGRPDKHVFDIAGDGSFLMNMQEICTAVQYRVGVKVAILNNKFLGMIRQWQHLFYNKRYSYSCLECQPDFVKLADAYGCVGLIAEKPSEVADVIAESLKIEDKPVLMDFRVDREENVYPMVPAGAALNEMIYGE
ncbi:biosynthetic-type acetolactate synthase large subunit [Deferribacterales bacterium Es71-Z0220]|jgi:acetolactate synthase-1/2/3 large subunit|uniref:biosynthetic-type acetolactate synthase large subunit n=1 Tax=Deferrivibrio essentukiensis TaxID=2880922 RepID=UPI001F60B16D|nr:biosynthetic-type acetolactate synthase large subunit [Deferrivibrio essentukiensis]MBZ4672862.1 acetolactate synthase, large subunit, biosynthetic type [Deferribacteraceae bacterium]MCB4205287.1 biosynthetic-type acetolactate synthase large subunit [Deferrivibrio essentukiensis]